jgi:polyphosphate kinase 2 (PPK2 family)
MVMGERIDQFCENLRIKLTSIDNNTQELKAKIDSKAIFNRSYYEEVLVVRVHPELLERQKLPSPLVSKRIWDERLADIAHFEDYVARQGTKILKFFLHVSRKEQKKRER